MVDVSVKKKMNKIENDEETVEGGRMKEQAELTKAEPYSSAMYRNMVRSRLAMPQ